VLVVTGGCSHEQRRLGRPAIQRTRASCRHGTAEVEHTALGGAVGGVVGFAVLLGLCCVPWASLCFLGFLFSWALLCSLGFAVLRGNTIRILSSGDSVCMLFGIPGLLVCTTSRYDEGDYLDAVGEDGEGVDDDNDDDDGDDSEEEEGEEGNSEEGEGSSWCTAC